MNTFYHNIRVIFWLDLMNNIFFLAYNFFSFLYLKKYNSGFKPTKKTLTFQNFGFRSFRGMYIFRDVSCLFKMIAYIYRQNDRTKAIWKLGTYISKGSIVKWIKREMDKFEILNFNRQEQGFYSIKFQFVCRITLFRLNSLK